MYNFFSIALLNYSCLFYFIIFFIIATVHCFTLKTKLIFTKGQVSSPQK